MATYITTSYKSESKVKPVFECTLCSMPVIYWWNRKELKQMGKKFNVVLDLEGRPHSCPKFYQRRKWQQLKNETLQNRDFHKSKHLCSFCRNEYIRDEMIAHHLIPFSIRPDLGLCSFNVIGICQTCHNKLHSSKIEYIALMKDWNYDDFLQKSVITEFDHDLLIHVITEKYFPKPSDWWNTPIL